MIKTFIIILVTWAFLIPDIPVLQKTPEKRNTVKIGLLINNNRSVAAKNGAEMAISTANEKEGTDGNHFHLVVRSMEGPWGTGSKEAVNLVFDENVWAIVGSHDGRNAHLVEQVIAKTHVVFISAWATDPTLSQAFVPWYFSCVPNTNQQADAMLGNIYNQSVTVKVATISDKDYDSKSALKSFIEKSKISGYPDPLQLFYDNSSQNLSDLLDKINSEDISCVVLFGNPTGSQKIIQQMRDRKMSQSVYGTLSVIGEDEFPELEMANYENVILTTSGKWLKSEGLSFRQQYQKTYGKIPGAVAAYAYDGMNLIIEAIRNSGFDRDKIQKSLSKIDYKGVTGEIEFDGNGNRMKSGCMIEIKNGIPVQVVK